eukprot:scaffold2011_cov26-Cyclotella_meneghiniana.AAC.3
MAVSIAAWIAASLSAEGEKDATKALAALRHWLRNEHLVSPPLLPLLPLPPPPFVPESAAAGARLNSSWTRGAMTLT